jgi:tetratricopeptide (TPR) repeat protein
VGEWTVGQVLTGLAGVLGLGALIGWYFQETLKQILPTPRRIARWMKGRDVPPAPGTHFTVLIADLEGDDERLSQTSHVEAALEGHEGLEVVRIGIGPRLGDAGSRSERQLAAERQGRARLQEKNGDVLIFGEVAEANSKLRLRFLARHEGLQGKARSYALEAADLPKNFGTDFNAALLAWVGASVAPATEQAGQYVADLLKPTAGKLRHLCTHLPAGLDADQRGSLVHSFALAVTVLGEQTGESAWLEEAVAAYRAALEVRTRERVPLDWAMTQNNLGNALSRLGEREDGTQRLQEAVEAYRAALEVRTRERVPLDWAMTQNNLGSALRALGEREDGASDAGRGRLEEAVAAFRAALEVRTRERVPLQWAGTQNNLGNALRALGERQDGTLDAGRRRLEEAVAAYRAALEVYRPAGASYYVGLAERNLAGAEALLAGRLSEPSAARR